MQGIAIVSADAGVRESLRMMLHSGRTIRECRSLAECLALATTEKLDFIFVDDVFEGGTVDELIGSLHGLGYGIEIIPILLSCDPVYQERFRPHGIRHCITKPFNVHQILRILEQIEEITRSSNSTIEAAVGAAREEHARAADKAAAAEPATRDDDAVREISQRFRKLLARMQNRQDLIRTFADGLQEQFDVDNVVVLLPADDKPVYDVRYGDIAPDVKCQFFIPMDDPLVQSLARLGEPVRVHDCERLGRENAVTAIRYGERLGIQVLCPILCHGKLKAIVALSRFHRYNGSAAPAKLLRPFITFFAEALENCELYERMSRMEETFRAMFDTLADGAIAVSAAGRIQTLNPAAARLLEINAKNVVDQPVERAGSMIAHCARTALESKQATEPCTLVVNGRWHEIFAKPMAFDSGTTGAVVQIRPANREEDAPEDTRLDATENRQLWDDMTRMIAHNFKNAFVPLQTCAELLPEKFQDDSFRTFFQDTVGDSIQRLGQWIDQLLGFSHLNESEDWTSTPLHDILAEAIAQAQSHLPQTQAKFTTRYLRDDRVAGRRPILQQIFREIINNALEAVQDVPDPTIDIECSLAHETLRVQIQDNGCGLGEKSPETAFRPFASRHLTGKLGLGLTYAQQALAVHGGTIELSAREQGGTNVLVTLPLDRRPPAKTTCDETVESREQAS